MSQNLKSKMNNLRQVNGFSHGYGHTKGNVGTEFALLFDIDGVIARGGTVIPAAVEAFKHLSDGHGNLIYPICFVTNGLSRSCEKATWLSEILNVKVSTDQVMSAASPLKVFHSFHKKRVLVVGQGNINEIASDLGFTNTVYMQELKDHFPLHDIVDHADRKRLAEDDSIAVEAAKKAKHFAPIEAILILGEPAKWEQGLQFILDLLHSDGDLRHPPKYLPYPHIPLIACNMDLVFKAQAPMPRFGNGAFLASLEVLYKRITGAKMQYTAIIGKPCEITLRYAEHQLNEERQKLHIPHHIKRLYFVGDNPNVDMAAANWYHDFLRYNRRVRTESDSSNDEKDVPDAQDCVPASRLIPSEANFTPVSAERCEGILVKTGVYVDSGDNKMPRIMKNHKDICLERSQLKPKHIVDTVLDAVNLVLEKEVTDILEMPDEESAEGEDEAFAQITRGAQMISVN